METVQLNHWEIGLDVRRDSRVTDDGRLTVADNVYIGQGRQIRKRPGMNLVTTLEPGTTGLMSGGGKLNTFYTAGAIVHAVAPFKANKVTHPSLVQSIARANVGTMFNGFLYVVVEYANGDTFHHYLDGVAPSYIADANCPNTRVIFKQNSKLYAPGKTPNTNIVRFCSTANGARDWTTASDAGFIATGLRAEGDEQVYALGQFRKMLAVLMIDSVQVWQTDPDPSKIAIFQNIYGIGTKFPKASMRLAGDSYFLSSQGVRSMTVVTFTDNLQEVDVGSPIDDLIKPLINATPAPNPISLYVQKLGQYWLIFGTFAYVYTFSKTAQIAAWSRYTFTFNVDAACEYLGDVYIRNGDNVYVLVEGVYQDAGKPIPVVIEMPWNDAGKPGMNKQWLGADVISTGVNAMLSFRHNANKPLLSTEAISIPNSTDQGPNYPVEVMASRIAPIITHSANEDFRLHELLLYWEPSDGQG